MPHLSFFAYSWKLPAYSGAFLLTVVLGSFFAYSWSFFTLTISAFALTQEPAPGATVSNLLVGTFLKETPQKLDFKDMREELNLKRSSTCLSESSPDKSGQYSLISCEPSRGWRFQRHKDCAFSELKIPITVRLYLVSSAMQ